MYDVMAVGEHDNIAYLAYVDRVACKYEYYALEYVWNVCFMFMFSENIPCKKKPDVERTSEGRLRMIVTDCYDS
jgi:hypothetical protein